MICIYISVLIFPLNAGPVQTYQAPSMPLLPYPVQYYSIASKFIPQPRVLVGTLWTSVKDPFLLEDSAVYPAHIRRTTSYLRFLEVLLATPVIKKFKLVQFFRILHPFYSLGIRHKPDVRSLQDIVEEFLKEKKVQSSRNFNFIPNTNSENVQQLLN